MPQHKDWDKIARELSSGEDSDAQDELNVLSVQRNAHRVAELLHGTVPGLDPTQMRAPPMGTNNADFIRDGLAASMRAWSRHSPGFRAAPPGASPDESGASSSSTVTTREREDESRTTKLPPSTSKA